MADDNIRLQIDSLTLPDSSGNSQTYDIDLPPDNVIRQHAEEKGSAFSSNLYKITTNEQGHVTAATAVTSTDLANIINLSDLGLSSAMHFIGSSSTEISHGSNQNPTINGTVYNNKQAGDVVLYNTQEFVYTANNVWQLLGDEGSYKIKQTTVSDPIASGNSTSFIATISQDTNGIITATKANLPISTLTKNSLVYTDDNNLLYAGYHYTDTEHLAICSTSQPTTNFYVNGTAQIDNLLTLYRSGSTESNLPAGILFSVKDTTLNTTYRNNQFSYIKVYHDHDSTTVDSNQNHVTLGTNMVISAGGNLYLGGGESSGALYNAQGSSNAENAFLTADSSVYIYADCNAIANRVGVKIEKTTGNLVPQKTEQSNDNVQSLGDSNNKWANAYVNNIIGNPLYLKTQNNLIYLKGNTLNGEKEIGRFQISNNGYRALVLGVASSNEDLGDTPGRLFFYSGSGAASISAAKTSGWNDHVLPVNGGWLVTAGNGSTTGAGNTNIPVYINSDGVATTINLSLTANNLINNLSTGSTIPADNDYFISQYVNGGTSTTTYHRRPISKLYEYIRNKAATNTSGMYDIIPTTNNTYSLGSSTQEWANVYAKNFKGNADTATKIQSINLYKPSEATSATGFRLILQDKITTWYNKRITFAITSRHNGNGIVSISYGCNASSLTKANCYAQIRYYGNSSLNTGGNIQADSCVAYLNENNFKIYFFWKHWDGSNSYIVPLSQSANPLVSANTSYDIPNQTTISAQTYIDSNTIPSNYGTLFSQIQENVSTSLQTGRTLKVNLASNSVSTAFNGSADITDIGVSGILPVTYGGTGATTTSGAWDNIVKPGGQMTGDLNLFTIGTESSKLIFSRNNGSDPGKQWSIYNNNGNLIFNTANSTESNATFTTKLTLNAETGNITIGGHIFPSITNSKDLGSPTYRWNNLYANYIYNNNLTEGYALIGGGNNNPITAREILHFTSTSSAGYVNGEENNKLIDQQTLGFWNGSHGADSSNGSYLIYFKYAYFNAGNFIPRNSNSYTLGSSAFSWSKLYIGSNSTYGSSIQPIYWNNGVPTPVNQMDTNPEHLGSASRSNLVPFIDNNSVMNIGKYIQFNVPNSNYSYDYRITASEGNGNGLGTLELSGKVCINLDSDATSSNKDSGSLVIGSKTGSHIAIDGNEIMARSYSNSTATTSTLYLNNDGGSTQIGGSLQTGGNIIPSATSTYNLGSSSKKWDTLFVNSIEPSYKIILSEDKEITSRTGSTSYINLATTASANSGGQIPNGVYLIMVQAKCIATLSNSSTTNHIITGGGVIPWAEGSGPYANYNVSSDLTMVTANSVACLYFDMGDTHTRIRIKMSPTNSNVAKLTIKKDSSIYFIRIGDLFSLS